MKLHKFEKLALKLIAAGLITMIAGLFTWLPIFYIGAALLLVGGFIWNPFDIFS